MSSTPPRKLPKISLALFHKYLARYVRHHPTSTRTNPPVNTVRLPTEPGAGVFLYPSDSWTKTAAVATGPLGVTHDKIHPSKFQIFRPIAETSAAPELHYWGMGGATRIVKNLVSGVSEGFAVTLELHGVGYRAEADTQRGMLVLRLGFSHIIEMPLEEGGVFFKVIHPQLLQVAGVNRSDVHQKAAKVRALRPPEPYKGKGVRYQSEPVRRKETKKD